MNGVVIGFGIVAIVAAVYIFAKYGSKIKNPVKETKDGNNDSTNDGGTPGDGGNEDVPVS